MSPATLFRRTSLALACAALAASLVARVNADTPLIKIHVATPGGDANAGAWYAQDEGFFRKVGLDADVQILRGSGAGITAAVVGGGADIGEADLIAIAAARQHGIPLVILAPSGMYNGQAPTTQLIVQRGGPIKSAKDLDGKTVAVLSLEGPSKVGTAEWIDHNGGSSANVHFIEMPAPQMGEAVARGTIAAATVPEPMLTLAREKTQVLGDVYTAIAPRFQLAAWFATVDWVKKNPAAAKAFAEAIHEAAVWGNKPANHARSADILAKHTKIDPALLPRMTRATYGETFDTSLAQPLLDAGTKYRSLQKQQSARELIQS
ncbi:MAG TPA: ABC transporter substrate-binding protein [Candidatus Acidoferrum sp.]|jgi:NitT/TauT family transport system substrate-binding protein|nr:ABC transporter substrate-binding protein [Candidatus Acidoferrum sp.]